MSYETAPTNKSGWEALTRHAALLYRHSVSEKEGKTYQVGNEQSRPQE